MYQTDSWDGKYFLPCYIIVAIEYEALFCVEKKDHWSLSWIELWLLRFFVWNVGLNQI